LHCNKEIKMNNMQKAGGMGALLLAVSFVLLIVANVVIPPSLGITGEADWGNPAKLSAVASAARIIGLIQILFAAAFTLTAPGLNDRLQERSPNLMRIATASGLGGAVLFLASGMFNFAAAPALASLYAQDPAAVTTADLAVAGGVADALITAAIFAAGWWALLASWAGLQGGLPKILSYLGLLFGALGILSFAIPPFNPLAALFGIVWSAWLGIVLRRS
jgi:uncharacterized protein DUF4386